MQTLGGGIVRYVGVQLLPCPEDPVRVGQVIGPAQIDILWQGRVAESFALRSGDDLLVPDGAEVSPGTHLIAWNNWQRTLRAPIPEGVEAIVRWSAPITASDEIAGTPRRRFAHGAAPIVLELLVDDVAIVTLSVDPQAQPVVDTGAVVRRGDPLAWRYDHRFDHRYQTGIDHTRAFLDVRHLHHRAAALIAPRDATVICVGQRWIVLRTTDDRVLRLRRRQQAHIVVRVGDMVVAGETLTDGERNHHALLHAWGEQRLGEHLVGELAAMLDHRVPRRYLALTVRAMLEGGRLRGIATIVRDRRSRRVRPGDGRREPL